MYNSLKLIMFLPQSIFCPTDYGVRSVRGVVDCEGMYINVFIVGIGGVIFIYRLKC